MGTVSTEFSNQKLKLGEWKNASTAKSDVHVYKARGTTPIPERSDGIEPNAKVPFAVAQEVRSWRNCLKNQL